MATDGSVSLLQITDLHLLPAENAQLLGVDTASSLEAVLRSALAQRIPDGLLVSGDIAHTPADATYARVRGLIAKHYRGPALWLAGNHDLTAPFASGCTLKKFQGRAKRILGVYENVAALFCMPLRCTAFDCYSEVARTL